MDFKTHSLNSYSDISSTFFVFTRCIMFWQHDLKYWISNCDLTVNILKSTPHIKASCLKTLWSLIINFSIPFVEIFFSEQIPIFCSYGNKVQYLILSFYFYSIDLNSRNHIFSWITQTAIQICFCWYLEYNPILIWEFYKELFVYILYYHIIIYITTLNVVYTNLCWKISYS